MLDPLAESVRSALETQRSQLGIALLEARDAVQHSLPQTPAGDWRGASSERYAADLLLLRQMIDRALSEMDSAYDETRRALVTLAARGN